MATTMNATPTPLPQPLIGYPRADLGAALAQVGIPAGHAARLFGHLHRRRAPAEAFTAMAPAQRARAAEVFPTGACALVETHGTTDATEKLVFRLHDGARVEGVIIPEGPRTTFCVSSQVGCAMACAFCATARLGLARGLTPAEIVGQIYAAVPRCEAAGRPLRNVVFMGMGEPLHHYENTRAAISILTDPGGLALAYDRVTVSTVGLVPRMAQLGRDFGGRVQLALSLNAGTDTTRRRLMPVTERWGLEALRTAVAEYPVRPNRGVLVEYVLLRGVNDTPAELDGLADWARGLPVVVNLIPWNPFDGADFESPTSADLDRAYAHLVERRIRVKVRLPRGRTAAAACGQLALAGAVGPAEVA
jgi:23S rRNA (adenine2503-C2)-methyltransferase